MKMNKEMHSSFSSSRLTSASPSLNSYSSSNNTLAEIAARVAHEFSLDEPLPFDWDDDDEPLQQFYDEEQIPIRSTDGEFYGDEDEDDGELDFSFVCGKTESSLVPADEIFENGKIKPIYPISAGDSSTTAVGGRIDGEAVKKPTRRPQLRVLMGVDRAERDAESSCSSSEADELDAISPGTYCVWKPGEACKKSSSTRSSSASSSRRWKLKQLLLNRSNSDGTKGIVLLAAKTRESGGGKDGGDDAGKAKAGEEVESCERTHNNSQRKSFLPLPYRTGLVGFFGNVNGLSRNLHAF